MNSIWNNLYDRFKDRRYGMLFFVSAIASVGFLLAGKMIAEAIEKFGWQRFLTAIIALCVVGIGRAWRHSRRPRERMKSEPLSGDEWRKARSKLMRSQKVG